MSIELFKTDASRPKSFSVLAKSALDDNYLSIGATAE